MSLRAQVNHLVHLDRSGSLDRYLVKDLLKLEGWQEFVDDTFLLAYRLLHVEITRISVQKGLLRFEFTSSDELESRIMTRYFDSIAKDSALCCVVCGQHGNRRKLEVGWPCLCKTHYIEYVNDPE